jgi:cyclophilin family peptidyl-prolyl cis-trans isomerase
MKEAPLKNTIYAFLVLAIAACTPASTANSDTAVTSASTTSATTTAATTEASVPPPASPTTAAAENKPISQYQNKVAELHTSAGEIDIRFFPDLAPNHVKNFIDLAEKGFYNGIKFHRVIPGFMIQGGDPNTISGPPATWGGGGSDKHVAAEFSATPHKRGIVSMARLPGDVNSASSQFFIVTADAPSLDGQYSVFGQVTKGMDVADKIVNAPRDAQDRPNDPSTIKKIVIRDAKSEEKGSTPK